jgi:hypothetical protein
MLAVNEEQPGALYLVQLGFTEHGVHLEKYHALMIREPNVLRDGNVLVQTPAGLQRTRFKTIDSGEVK